MAGAGKHDKEKRNEPDAAGPYVVRNPERFALNLARAMEEAGKAAAAYRAPGAA